MTAAKISVELSPVGEYPPGEEWRDKVQKAIAILVDLPESSDQWVKVSPIEAAIVNRVRSAAHAAARSNSLFLSLGDEWRLVTRYDPEGQAFWMTMEKTSPSADEEE